ncbi:sensor domain-containing protein [Natronosporangium hydrolyticum]|uniref:sensor domain-containing protein n=1 Tax=Natronosporangium hydrolyticum TaxID=2811111 RepID=UPI001EFA1822|nr:sensor domain-containing protein [Natronosporangium hydrolyticum]
MAVAAPVHALAALRRPRFLVTGWPWRSLGYLATSSAISMALSPVALMLGMPWLLVLVWLNEGRPGPLGLGVLGVAFGLLLVAAAGPLLSIPTAIVERWRLRLVDDRPARSGHRALAAPGLWAWLRTRYTEPATLV